MFHLAPALSSCFTSASSSSPTSYNVSRLAKELERHMWESEEVIEQERVSQRQESRGTWTMNRLQETSAATSGSDSSSLWLALC